MPYKTLPIGIVLNEKYEIKKVLSSSEKGAVYLAFDKKTTERNWVVKEIALPENLPSDELKLRINKFNEALASLINYENVHLARILDYFAFGRNMYVVMEYIEGLTLRQFCSTNIAPLTEKQMLEWSLEICDGMYYLHNRPHPFLFDVLTPENIIIDKNEKLKLINFGLDRFFDVRSPREIFSQAEIDSSADLSIEFNQFAKTIYFLIDKKELTENEIPSLINISKNLEKVLSDCIKPDSSLIYKNFLELKNELYKILYPEAEKIIPKPKKRKILTRQNVQFVKESISSGVDAVLSQKISYLAVEIVGAILIIFSIWRMFFFVPPYMKKFPTVYVLCNKKEIVAVNKDKLKIIKNFFLEQSYTNIQSDQKGQFLYLADSVKDKITVLDAKTLKSIKSILVDKDPEKMIVTDDNKKLFVVHKSTNNISEISIPLNKTTNILPVNKSPEDIAISNITGLIYVTCPKIDTVSVINLKNYSGVANLDVGGGPQAVITSKKDNKIYISQKETNSVIVLKTYLDNDKFEYEVAQRINDTGGKEPIGLFLEPKEHYLFILNAKTKNIGVINLATGKLKNTISLEKPPRKMIFVKPDYLWIIKHSSEDITVVDTILESVRRTSKIGKDPTAITLSP